MPFSGQGRVSITKLYTHYSALLINHHQNSLLASQIIMSHKSTNQCLSRLVTGMKNYWKEMNVQAVIRNNTLYS